MQNPLGSNSEAGVNQNPQMNDVDVRMSAYFLQAGSDPASLLKLSDSNTTIARVVVLERPNYLVGRDQSGRAPSLPKDLFSAKVKVVGIISGTMTRHDNIKVVFGVPGSGRLAIYPHTPDQLSLEYDVAISLDADGSYRLRDVPVSKAVYEKWQAEFYKYELQRSAPGPK